MKNFDVVVAGAGPVGLVAALVLAEAGVKVALLEKRDQLNQASKASTFHPPTLTILDKLGVFAPFQAQAQHVDRIQYRTTADGVLGHLRYALLEGLTPHPYRKHLEQSELTPLLLDRLLACPSATVLFGTEVSAIENRADGVNITALRHGREAGIASRFIIGADGAHSRVRESAGIAAEGMPYPGKVLRVMADESLEALLPDLAPLTYLVNESHSASFLRMPDCWRIILRIPPDVDPDHAATDGWILERLRPLIPGIEALPNILGRDSYGASKRVAQSCRKGNVYLAGDSAHLSNTRGGMNMNCGIHDAYQIASAMVRAVQHDDLPGLHAAADERHRIATECLIPRSDSMVSAEGSWIERVQALLGNPQRARDYLAQTAMLDMVDLRQPLPPTPENPS